MRFDKFSPQTLRSAIEIEMQKTDDMKKAADIAITRLKKDPDYYNDMMGLAKAKDLSKLVKKVVTDKRGHRRTVWVKGSDVKKEEKPNSILTSVQEKGKIFKTGKSVEFEYIRNNESSKTHTKGNRFQQDIEPSGKYITMSSGYVPDGWESGTVKFSNPLVVKFSTDGNDSYNESSWKSILNKKYKKRGTGLSNAIKKDGYDGIVTVTSKGYTSEIIDLTKSMQKAKDTSKLVKKIITNKKGHRQTVYVKAHEAKKENWLNSFMGLFNFKDKKQAEQKIRDDYKKNEVEEKFDLSINGWKNHLSEYFKNKDKWQKFFGKKDKKDKVPTDKKTKKGEKKKATEKKAGKFKLSAMKFINDLYGGPVKKEEKEVPETKEQVKKDKDIAKDLNDATPENRVETEMAVMGAEKEPWGMTFDEYKKEEIVKRDESTIKTLEKDIKRFQEKLEKEDMADMQRNWAEKRLKEYENLLDKYIKGVIDAEYKLNPAWDYLQKQYDDISDKDSKEGKSLKRRLSIKNNKAKKEHERLIKKAINDGSIIPANVLKEYPDIMKEDAKKMVIPDINYKPESFEKTFELGAGEPLPSGVYTKKINVQDYTKVPPKDVYLVDEEIILDVPRPSYVPEMDLKDFAGYKGKKQTFDIVRIGPNQYMIVDERYQVDLAGGWGKDANRKETDKGVEASKYYLMNAETLASTWDYYRKLYRETLRVEHEIKQDAEEAYYNKQKKESTDKGRDWGYAPFKRKGYRGKNIVPDARHMTYGQAFFIQDMTNFQAPVSAFRPKKGESTEVNQKLFENYQTMLKELDYKINDMRIQKQMNDESATYKKGQETAYGDKGLKNDLLDSLGVKVKRQNGAEIDDNEIARVGMLVEDLYSVFGDRSEMSRKWGLKISYAGTKRMHASKAIGMFAPSYKAIAISDDGIEGRGFTFAHEFTHFMDTYLGEKEGLYYHSSDEDGSIANNIAVDFRKKINLNENKLGKDSIDYFYRTSECFARAMEQFYAIKQGTEQELYEKRNKLGSYMRHEQFVDEVMPLCENFLKEKNALLKAMFQENNNLLVKTFNPETHQFEYRKVK